MPAVPGAAGVPSAKELAALPHDELAARLAEASRVIAGLTARVGCWKRRAGRQARLTGVPGSAPAPTAQG